MKIKLHKNDLPDGLDLGPVVAIDSETLGLNPFRDRLCLVQLSSGDGTAHAVQFAPGQFAAPNLKRMLADPKVLKLFHYARFDMGMFRRYLEVMTAPVYCTKIASKLVRTYTDRHGLKDLVRELLGVELSKEQQSSDWGAKALTEKQLAYAASDVAHLHQLKTVLDQMLAREGRTHLAQASFDFLPTRAQLDALQQWQSSAACDPLQHAALRLAATMTRDVQVPEALMREVRAQLDDRQVVELVGTIAAYNMVSRFLEALQIHSGDAREATI